MQTDARARLAGQSASDSAEFVRKLSALVTNINTLQALMHIEDDGDGMGESLPPDLPALRQGLAVLERLAGEMLYELQATSSGLLLADLPQGLALTEALSQLVESTAEALDLSSRVAFSGKERPLPDYLSRLLYRIAQEALARVPTHAGAHRLRFSLEYRHADITLGIEDDGVPNGEEQFFREETNADTTAFPPFLTSDESEQNAPLAGQTMRHLRGMVENLGGALVINSSVEQGIQIQTHIPYNAPARIEEVATPLAIQEPVAVPARIRVLVVAGQTVSRVGLRRLLESYPDLEVVGEASDSVQAVSEAAELLPRIVLIDTQLPPGESLETLRQLRQLQTELHVLLLLGEEDEDLLYEALRGGASGYVLKNMAPDELAQAVRTAAHGEVTLQSQMATRLLARLGNQERNRGNGLAQESLTTREREVLQLLVRGLRNKEIAARLFVSERTVAFHLANIYAKLHVSGRTEALSKALEQGIIKV